MMNAGSNAHPPGSPDWDTQQLRFLAQAIFEGRAFVYIGAGASVPRGLPVWRALLKYLFDEGAVPLLAGDQSGKEFLKELVDSSRYLEAADMLQDILDSNLELLLAERFKERLTPSQIHSNVSRIPFRMAI